MNSMEPTRPVARGASSRSEPKVRSRSNVTANAEKPAAAPGSQEPHGQKVRKMLRAQLGEDVYTSWFHSMEFEPFDGQVVRVTVPVKFLKNWIQSHYSEVLLKCCAAEFEGAERVEVALRQPSPVRSVVSDAATEQPSSIARPTSPEMNWQMARPAVSGIGTRTQGGGFEGSPLDPRYTFESFAVGPANRMAHAGATQVAETVLSDSRGFNPLFIHSAVGLGKTHLLHAIAWSVRRRVPQAQVLYLTAERFRYQFVEALKSQDPLSFKEKFRSIHMLLVDDLEFLHGQQTEQEFDHVINSLLDGGRQVVVASARAPNHIQKLNERMRSRLQRGLVTEIGAPDAELRLRILETRVQEKKQLDPTFEIHSDILELLANRLHESGRELEGAITRLHATWQYMRTQITVDIAETVIRDLVHGMEPRRIKIEDILKIVSRHFGISRSDILSQRRHRSVVWPRQIGMYLAKQLTSRSLPEIGRRFGNRDHTTVLHAIRKIDGLLGDNPGLRDELEELKKMLNS